MRNVKIVYTLGPTSFDRETIRGLTDIGMSVAQMNANHDNVEHRSGVIDSIRAVDDAADEPLAAMLDLQGPEVRTADTDEDIYPEAGSEVRFCEDGEATPGAVGLSYSITAAEADDTTLLDDGRIEATVEYVEDDSIHAIIVSGGELSSRKGVSVPGVDLDIDLITDSDYENLKLATEKEVDYVAASFIRDAEDVYTVSDTLENLGAEIPIIAKIERAGAVDNLDEIIQAAYGVMVARGDFGVECPLEEVPTIQKRTIRKAQATGTSVVTATEMLDPVARPRRPTRAETSDVANAVLGGIDAMMLSGETAVGDHPVRVVETMSRTVKEVEASPEYDESQEQRVPTADEGSRIEAPARSARYLARDVNAAAVVAVSESGYITRKTARFRPGVPVVAVTPNDRTRRQLAVSWGISAQYVGYNPSVEGVMGDAVTTALDAGVAESGDTIVVLSGTMTELEGTNTTNMLKIHVAAESTATSRKIIGGRVAGPLYRTEDGDLTDVPEGAALALSSEFDGEFDSDADKLAGIVDARADMTGYPAFVACELNIPMASGAPLPKTIAQGATVTLHTGRGIVYESDIINHDRDSR